MSNERTNAYEDDQAVVDHQESQPSAGEPNGFGLLDEIVSDGVHHPSEQVVLALEAPTLQGERSSAMEVPMFIIPLVGIGELEYTIQQQSPINPNPEQQQQENLFPVVTQNAPLHGHFPQVGNMEMMANASNYGGAYPVPSPPPPPAPAQPQGTMMSGLVHGNGNYHNMINPNFGGAHQLPTMQQQHGQLPFAQQPSQNSMQMQGHGIGGSDVPLPTGIPMTLAQQWPNNPNLPAAPVSSLSLGMGASSEMIQPQGQTAGFNLGGGGSSPSNQHQHGLMNFEPHREFHEFVGESSTRNVRRRMDNNLQANNQQPPAEYQGEGNMIQYVQPNANTNPRLLDSQDPPMQ